MLQRIFKLPNLPATIDVDWNKDRPRHRHKVSPVFGNNTLAMLRFLKSRGGVDDLLITEENTGIAFWYWHGKDPF